MTAQTISLTAFLLARYAEDEAVAQAAASDPLGSIEAGIKADALKAEEDGDAEGPTLLWAAARTADAVARLRPRTLHDPARVLAECEAKRQIVELHTPLNGEDCDPSCGDIMSPCKTLAAFAAVYADHPDYCEEWRV